MNPEFIRNVILSSTPFRQIVLPITMLAFLYLFYLINGQLMGKGLAIACAIIFLVVMLLWGSREVSDSLMDEIQEKTWDFQRMSAMGAWSMVWGKLLGSSFYVLLTCSMALVVYIYSISDLQNIEFILKSVFLLITIAFIGLAIAFLSTLFLIRKSSIANAKLSNGINLILTLYILWLAIPFVDLKQNQSISWYHHQFNWLDFNLFSAITILAWLMLGNYRLMRQELQYKNSPIIWTIFIFFILFYLSGFLLDYYSIREGTYQEYLTILAPWLFILMIPITWISIYFSDNKITTIHRYLFSISTPRWTEIWLYSPLWLISFVILVGTGTWLLFNNNNLLAQPFLMLWWQTTPTISGQFILMCLLFILRDIAISLYFNFTNSFKRPDSSAFILIVLLYLLFPSIVNLTLGNDWLFLFLPILKQSGWSQLIPVSLQVFIAFALVWFHYRSRSPKKR